MPGVIGPIFIIIAKPPRACGIRRGRFPAGTWGFRADFGVPLSVWLALYKAPDYHAQVWACSTPLVTNRVLCTTCVLPVCPQPILRSGATVDAVETPVAGGVADDVMILLLEVN